MAFNEDSRVKIPALLHLTRLGYSYLSRKEHHKRQEETNIFKHIFLESLGRINNGVTKAELLNAMAMVTLRNISTCKVEYVLTAGVMECNGKRQCTDAHKQSVHALSIAAEDATGMGRKNEDGNKPDSLSKNNRLYVVLVTE